MDNIASEARKKDHPERQELRKLIDEEHEGRRAIPIPEEKRTAQITVPGENEETKTASMEEMEEELNSSDVGQLILENGLLSLPVGDYIKDTHGLMSVETTERLEEDLRVMHKGLIKLGFGVEEIKKGLKEKKSKLDSYKKKK